MAPIHYFEMAVFARILNNHTCPPKTPVEIEQSKPFSLWKANNEIKLCSIIQKSDSEQSNSVIYDPFADASHITYESYLFSFNRRKNIIDDETNRTYYFRCANPKRNCRCNLTVCVNPLKCSYDIRPSITPMSHNDKCVNCSPDGSLSISNAIKACQTWAIQLAQKKSGNITYEYNDCNGNQ